MFDSLSLCVRLFVAWLFVSASRSLTQVLLILSLILGLACGFQDARQAPGERLGSRKVFASLQSHEEEL